MPRVTMTVDRGGPQDGDAPVSLDDQVHPGAHPSDQDSSVQFRERRAGAIDEGARLEHVESVTSYLEIDRC